MRRLFVSIFILNFLFSCNSPSNNSSHKSSDTKRDRKLGFYMLQGDSVLVPPFEIEVSLSPKAKERIVNGNETIIVHVFLEGAPKDPSNVHLEEDGSFFVGSAKEEVSYGKVARFDNLRFPKKIYDQLADKDVDLTVNVYTGRKSSPDNLITGDFLADKISNIINKRLTVYEKLIFGDD